MALSRGSPRVGVTHHLALWSPDFPRLRRYGHSTSGDRGAAITQPTHPSSTIRGLGHCPHTAQDGRNGSPTDRFAHPVGPYHLGRVPLSGKAKDPSQKEGAFAR